MTQVNEQQIRDLIQAHSVLLARDGLATLYENIFKMAGFGLGGILYNAGKKAGEQGVAILQNELGLSGDDLLYAALIAFNHSGWGRAELEHNGDTIRVHVHDSALAGTMQSRKPVCHPIAGYMAGFLEVALGRKVKVRETACVAAGADHCIFEGE
nr:V4R domain-containing protein [Ardenticatena sp.]